MFPTEKAMYYPLQFRNDFHVHGLLTSDPIPQDTGLIFIVTTDEEFGEKRFVTDHTIFVDRERDADKVRILSSSAKGDFLLLECELLANYQLHCKKLDNVTQALSSSLSMKNRSALPRNKNIGTVHGFVAEEVQDFKNGYLILIGTESRTDYARERVIIHTQAANTLKCVLEKTAKGDFVLVEGPLTRDRRLIVSDFNNLSLAVDPKGKARTMPTSP